jgi:hypothetical protein
LCYPSIWTRRIKVKKCWGQNTRVMLIRLGNIQSCRLNCSQGFPDRACPGWKMHQCWLKPIEVLPARMCLEYANILHSLPLRFAENRPSLTRGVSNIHGLTGFLAIIKYIGVKSFSFPPATKESPASAKLSAAFCIPFGMTPTISPSPTNR